MPFSFKLRRKPAVNSHKDNFIINYNCNKNNSDKNPARASLCCKRVIFTSLIGLFQTYNECPAHVLYSSLIIVPLKRKWVYSPSKYFAEMQSVSSGLIRKDKQSYDFFEFMRWKDSQCFVFWAKDEYKASSEKDIIHPFWRFVSQKLINLYDPITSQHYEAIPFDTNYWQKQMETTFKRSRSISICDILREMYFMTLNLKSMKQLINASNPNSFRVLRAYKDDLYANDVDNIGHRFVNFQQLDDESDVHTDDEWCVAPEYLVL